jgi:hypothetical protein
MGSSTLQVLQDPIWLLPWLCFRWRLSKPKPLSLEQAREQHTLWAGDVPLPTEFNVTFLLRLDRNSRSASLKTRMASLRRLRPDVSSAVLTKTLVGGNRTRGFGIYCLHICIQSKLLESERKHW